MRYLILDIETLPISNAAEFVSMDDIAAPANWKDPEKINGYCEAERQKRISAAALDMDLARVCAIGLASDRMEPKAILCQDDAVEASELAELGNDLDQFKAHSELLSIITFNGHAYDLPLLMRRAKYLSVPFPRINLDRYKSQHIDLYEELRMKRNDIKAHGLRWYMRRLGWTDLLEADPLKNGGADVAQAAAEGRWDDIAGHVLVDIKGTLRLAQWLGVVPATVAETAGAF
jgi:hypothetical protein